MQEHQSWAEGQEYHVHLAEQLQNGVGREKWEAGYEPYLGLLEQFQNAPQWEPLPRLGKGE